MKILGYVIIVIGIVAALFFDKYNGTLIPYPTLFFILSIFVCFLGAYLVYLPIKKEQENAENRYNKNKKWLMTHGVKLQVDLRKCKVKTFKSYINKPRHLNSEAQAWDALYEPEKAITKKEKLKSIITYKVDINGKTETFLSEGINKDDATLLFLIDNKKTTNLYYDSKNITNYFFDLTFLED